ncbi:MAG TPA: YjbH domain-containing protein, partial [Alphaproteobacteria bacterium]|nr:YjbH domain-containing protein [Alphaproteobacteria bacterium]
MGLIWRAVRRAAVVCGATAGLLAFCLAGFARADGLESGARLTGARGLNTVPDARMDAPGTLRAGVATSDPYLHAAVSAQLAGPLSLTLRQSARLSSLRDAPRALSPAVDVKLRISEEGPIAPALAVGADALFGARATASEYVVASKRFGDFDVTGGLAWGRLGRAGALGNPLGFLDREREGGEEGQSGPGDWLTGRRVGVFAGVAYVPAFAPSLTVKLDWSEDNYAAEKAADPGFDPPAPWSAAVSWRAAKGLEVGVGTVGAEKIMARVNLLGAPEGWGVRPYKTSVPPRLPERPARTNETAMRQMAGANGTDLSGVSLSPDGQTLSARLALDPHRPVALQIGRAARFMAGYGAARAQMLALSLDSAGTRGPVVVLPRGGLERMAAGRASPEEVWRGARIEPSVARPSGVFPATSGRFRWIVQTDLSVSERTAGILHRTALLADFEDFPAGGPLRMGGRVREAGQPPA